MPHSLAPLDFAVIALALRDSVSSLSHQGRLARLIFGPRQGELPLANPKLEALRRYVVLRRRLGDRRASEERGPLRSAGYDLPDLSEIDRLIDTLPPSRRQRRDILHTTRTGTDMHPSLRAYSRIILSAAFLPLAGWSQEAIAQVPPAADAPLMGPGEGPDGPGGPGGGPGGDHISIGIGGMYQPAFVGAKKYRFQPLPAIDIKQGMFFANFQNGIGVAPLETETLTAGVGVTMMDNYRRKDVPRGIDRVKFGAGVRGFVTVKKFDLEATAGLTQGIVGGTKGMIADFNLARPIMVNQRLFLMPSVTVRWANAKHSNRFYGVDAREAAASGFGQFRPGSGLLDAKADLGLMYQVSDRIGVGLIGGVTTLLGDNKDSPIVKKKTAPFGLGFVSYGF